MELPVQARHCFLAPSASQVDAEDPQVTDAAQAAPRLPIITTVRVSMRMAMTKGKPNKLKVKL